MRIARLRLGLVILMAMLLAPEAARALAPPEILYREGVSENEATGPWLPLDGANVSSLGLIIGTRTQAKPPSDSGVLYRLTALSVPDGHPDQGPSFDPARPCISNAQPEGSEVALGSGSFEGPGAYSIRLDARTPSEGATTFSCSGGASSTATFTIDPSVTLRLLAREAVPLAGEALEAFAKVTGLPVGGAGESQCARNAVIEGDGGVSGADRTPVLGPSVVRRHISRTGRWTCVARARSTYPDGAGEVHRTRWSEPVSFDVYDTFRAELAVIDGRGPRYEIAYTDLPPASRGGKITVRIRAGRACPSVPKQVLRATIGSSLRTRLRFRLPERDPAEIDSYGWVFDFSFGGTREIRPTRVRTGAFVLPDRFDFAGLNFPGGTSSYCTHDA